MRAIDTNVLVRLLVRDDPKQVAAAEAYVAGGAWVSLLALVETVWVLDAVYELKPRSLAAALEMLLDHQSLAIQDGELVAAALAAFRAHPKVGFSDCVMVELARRAGHLPLGTFDRALAKLDGAEKV
ncbi:MAG: PIN domain-containing protein [Deltaproteobacteria bacterium]|nr:PIN domain-containing protein [Deltaproteobacteria bacterium]